MKFLGFIKAFRRLKPEEFVNPLAAVGRFRVRCGLCGRVFRANSHTQRECRACGSEAQAFAHAGNGILKADSVSS